MKSQIRRQERLQEVEAAIQSLRDRRRGEQDILFTERRIERLEREWRYLDQRRAEHARR